MNRREVYGYRETKGGWTVFPASDLPAFTSIEHHAPQDIEAASMETIAAELSARGIAVESEVRPLVFRAIHASADFDYAENLVFSENVMAVAKTILLQKPVIVSDTNMALAGISKSACERLGIEKYCFMADDDVVEASRNSHLTRAACSVDKAANLFGAKGAGGDRALLPPLIYACGNAPTALVRLRQLHDAGIFSPALILALPVGFVNVVAAKELILQSDIPHIVMRGRKGGSSIAAAVMNALLYCVNA